MKAISKAILFSTSVLIGTYAHAQWNQMGSDIDGQLGEWLGRSLSMSDDGLTIAAGAGPGDVVRVYNWNAGAWVQLGGDLLAEYSNDDFGASVSLNADGTVLAVGAPNNPDAGSQAGSIRVFSYSGGNWTQVGGDIDGEADFDNSGGNAPGSISISDDGSIVAIGAFQNDGNGANSGHVRVYELIGGVWTQLGSDINGESNGDISGTSVSLSDDGLTVAIGANGNDAGGSFSDNRGHVRVFEYITGSWVQKGADIDGEAPDDHLGWAMEMTGDGNTLVIGGRRNDGNGSQAGHVRVYDYIAGTWTQRGADIDGEAAGDQFGTSVDISDDGLTIVVGAMLNDENGTNAGHARVFEYSGGSWMQVGADIDGEAAGDECGYSVGISSDGTIIGIGSHRNSEVGIYAGHVRIYSTNCVPSSITPDLGSLSDMNSECSVVAPTAPTASNCLGTFNGTPDVTFPITSQGTTVITWTYDDGNGNTSTQTQNVVINDNTAPVADVSNLPDLSDQCEITSLSPPTATDNCTGSITGTHTASLPIIASTTVTWTYDDGNGNTSTQTQNVVINDNTAPVADMANLSNVTAECEVTSLTPPTATDNCAGSITGTHNASLPIIAQGTTTVTWTYDDGNGNTSTQTQDVVITDATAPTADLANLADINSECEVTPTAPTATDNCAGAITGTPDVSFPITASGTTTVTWTYDDGNGNTSTQTQDVIITPIDVSTTTTPNTNDYTISANATGYNYQWIDCGNGNAAIAGSTAQGYTPIANGSYAVILDNGTCADTSDCVVIDDLGVEINDFGSAFKVYPNPTFGNLAIELGNVYNETSIIVFNALGQVDVNESFGLTDNLSIQIAGTPGMYILEIKTEEGRSARVRVIKK